MAGSCARWIRWVTACYRACGARRQLVWRGVGACAVLALAWPGWAVSASPAAVAQARLLAAVAPAARPSPRRSRGVHRRGSRPRLLAALGAAAEAGRSHGAAAGPSAWNLPRKRLDRPGAQEVAAEQVPEVFSYVVRAGDTLTSIAERFATDVASLERINGLTPNSVLPVGRRLTVLRRVGWLYRVRPGDTLDGIARATGVGVSALAAANGLVGASPVLEPGETLIIPKEPAVPSASGGQASAEGHGTGSTYTVQAGDTLSGVAAAYGVSVAALEAANGLSGANPILQVGQTLVIPGTAGSSPATAVGGASSITYTVRAGDTLSGVAAAYGVSVAALEAANGLSGPNPILQVGQTLTVPVTGDAAPTAATSAAPEGATTSVGTSGNLATTAAPRPASGPPLIWPVHGPITSPFGWRLNPWGGDGWFWHNGIDIGVPTGTHVEAACSGRVILASWDGGYGNAVEIACDDGLITMYAHNSAFAVQVGDEVQQGQLISYSGMTGNATGPHVHFGVKVNGVWQNPMNYLPQ